MTRNKQKQFNWQKLRRMAVSLALTVVAVLGLTSVLTPHAEASMEYYLDKVVEWGVMRGDINGNLNANRQITRAEFVTMVNRAYGYKDMGPNPFNDVKSKDWFYEDVCIGNKVGYFKGTTPTTASPYSKLTREQAAVIIGRNMMLEQGTGEALGFSDSRKLGDWSRHMIQAVAQEGIITGYSDGSFRPKNFVTRGQVAAMLVRAVGTPVQHPGEQSLGGVYGNVTITTPGVTLKDTTIYGDLYISGGVGLGNVVLENVKVMGKIVVSGTGESEKGEHSVVLRNVTADELVMDSLAQQFVTLKSEGLTDIAKVNVRTGAYLEDLTEEAYGLKNIVLDGPDGTKFQVAGNIKDVTMKTAKGELTLAQGIANSITVDEIAKDSILNIADKAMANTVNLDAGTKVTGTGDVGHMNVNAPDSSSTMLPDTIVVRPGINADINGEIMDNVAAQQSSEDPRLLSGYPAAKNVAPKTADAVFKTNKKGTIYWAVSSLMDGSVSEEDLIHPPVYSNKILVSGTVSADAADKEFVQKITKLISDGSYYISAMLVDNRGMHSPVKIAAFTTPDDSVPNFANGYPYAIIADGRDKEQIIQVMSMPTKDCLMYYALLPKGSVAPKPSDFKANAVTGNLGYGVVEVQKNTPYLVSKVNEAYLEEQKDYDLYLWLTDVDGVKSSAVKKLTVKTLDRTSPHIQHLDIADVSPTSVSMTYSLDEPGKFYWAVVKKGTPFYMPGVTPDSDEGKAQVATGVNSLKKGVSTASNGSTDVKFTISGLKPQTAYDLYYVAEDRAGNYCDYNIHVIPLPYEFHTLDDEAPTVVQDFLPPAETAAGRLEIRADANIRLIFSENVQCVLDRNDDGKPDYEQFLVTYEEYRKNKTPENGEKWASLLRSCIKLYQGDEITPVKERNATNEDAVDWVIDYRNVTVELDRSGTGELIMTIPYNKDPGLSALNLTGGTTYQFRLEGIADTSTHANYMQGQQGITRLPAFTTISAQVRLMDPSATRSDFHFIFDAKPVSHTAMSESVLYDMIVWSEVPVSFEVYQKTPGKDWEQIGVGKEATIPYADGNWAGVSIGNALKDGQFAPLREMQDTTYGIKITSMNNDRNDKNWNSPLTLRFTTVAGNDADLPEMGKRLVLGYTYEKLFRDLPRITDITVPLEFQLTHTFLDKEAPKFELHYPRIVPGDTSVKISVMLDRPNSHYYYMVAPLGRVNTVLKDGTILPPPEGNQRPDGTADFSAWEGLPQNGDDQPVFASKPNAFQVMKEIQATDEIMKGERDFKGSDDPIMLTGLHPNTKYVAYFVLRGEAPTPLSEVYCFRFETGDVATPIVFLSNKSPMVAVKTSTEAKTNWILMASNMVDMNPIFNQKFYNQIGYNANDKAKLKPGTTEDTITADKKAEFEQEFKKYLPSVTAYTDVRVIDVLTASFSNGMSLFDYYAGENVYQQVRDEILNPDQTTYVTSQGGPEDTNINWKNLSPEGMKGITQYYFIAAARHPMGSRYGFGAVPNVHNVVGDPPELAGDPSTVLTNAFEMNPDGTEGNPIAVPNTIERPIKYYYSGSVTVDFTKVPYRVVTQNGVTVTQTLVNGPAKDNTECDVKDCVTGQGLHVDKVTINNQSITIDFSKANVGQTPVIKIFNGGWIGDMYGNAHENVTLRLKFTGPFVNPIKPDKPLDTNSGLPRFEAEWSDGHTSKK